MWILLYYVKILVYIIEWGTSRLCKILKGALTEKGLRNTAVDDGDIFNVLCGVNEPHEAGNLVITASTIEQKGTFHCCLP